MFLRGGSLGDDGCSEGIAVDVIAQSGEYAACRDSIGHAVVDLHQHRPAITLQTLDDPAFPQWTIPVQSALQHIGDNSEQFGVIARPRNCHPAHVPAEVESRIVDPRWRTDIEGLGAQHLRAPRYCPDPFCQNIFEVAIIGHRTVDDRDSTDRQADVPVRILRHEETGIERIELLHDYSPPFHCWGLPTSIGGDQWSEVAARLIRVNNWGRLCGNVVQPENF
jgi:hypothetical protein